MGKLNYKIQMQSQLSDYEQDFLTSRIYKVTSLYDQPQIKNLFLDLKSNIVDLNSGLITKYIQGTEQDFVMLMNKAKDFINLKVPDDSCISVLLLELFRECVFGYYILTPLLKANDVSDIKVYAWDKITCKANGERYITNLQFYNEMDYNRWYERILRIQRLKINDDFALQHCTDRKGVDDFYLRIDMERKNIISTEDNCIHIRKIPKKKYSWDYLKEQGMLDDEMIMYFKDRIPSGYGFLISGRGGSGKSTLLNNMLDLIPYDESILVSQESDELYSENHPQIQFEHTDDKYSLEDELRMGLLQDIDNFVIGEIKGGEALYVFTTAMSTGARFFGTIHSNNAAGSIRRLAQCARYVSDYSVATLEEMLTSTPFCLIHMSRFSIDEILEIEGWNNDGQHLEFHEVYKKK